MTIVLLGLFSYAAWNRRIDLEDLGAFKMPGAFIGEETTGGVIALIIFILFVGYIPVLRNANCIFFSVKALLKATLKIGQKKDFDIEIVPVLLSKM